MHYKGQFIRAKLCYVMKLRNRRILISLKKYYSKTPAFEIGGVPFPYS